MDGESCDYATELAGIFLAAGCQVPEPIKTSLNDLPGYLVVTVHGTVDSSSVSNVTMAIQAAGIPIKSDPINENSVGTWYENAVHVIVGRRAP
jgi:hypothetical protein